MPIGLKYLLLIITIVVVGIIYNAVSSGRAVTDADRWVKHTVSQVGCTGLLSGLSCLARSGLERALNKDDE